MFGVMDGYDADLGHIAQMILDPQSGEIRDDLRDQMVGFESDMLVLCRARLEDGWRGLGLGAVLAGRAIKQLRTRLPRRGTRARLDTAREQTRR